MPSWLPPLALRVSYPRLTRSTVPKWSHRRVTACLANVSIAVIFVLPEMIGSMANTARWNFSAAGYLP